MSGDNSTQAQFTVIEEPRQIQEVLRLGLEVIAQKESGSEKRSAVITGWSLGRYLILEGLSSMVFSGALFQGNSLLVRFQYLGGVFGFAAQVRAVIKDPPLVVLAWPAKVERVHLTSEKRVALELEVILQGNGSDGEAASSEVVLRDLSRGGGQLMLAANRVNQETFTPQTAVSISFVPPGKGQPVAMSAEVANTRATTGGLVLGVHFNEGQDAKLDQLWSLAFPPLA